MDAISIQGGDSQQFRPFEKAFFKKKKKSSFLSWLCCVFTAVHRVFIVVWALSVVAVCGLLVEHRLQSSWASVVVVLG